MRSCRRSVHLNKICTGRRRQNQASNPVKRKTSLWPPLQTRLAQTSNISFSRGVLARTYNSQAPLQCKNAFLQSCHAWFFCFKFSTVSSPRVAADKIRQTTLSRGRLPCGHPSRHGWHRPQTSTFPEGRLQGRTTRKHHYNVKSVPAILSRLVLLLQIFHNFLTLGNSCRGQLPALGQTCCHQLAALSPCLVQCEGAVLPLRHRLRNPTR